MQRRGTWRRLSTGLALFALALQLVVSFAHVHAEDFAGLPRQGATQVTATDGTPGGHSDLDHLTCDICATVHLAGTLVVPVPPALVVPSFSIATQAIAPLPSRQTATSSAFLARGPPQA
jgi:hypothetical protein